LHFEKSMLWNTEDIKYRNRKKAVLEEIAVNFHCSLEETQREMRHLRNQLSPHAHFETNCRVDEETGADESEMDTVITLFAHSREIRYAVRS
ncbi:hypothetical protein WH47_08604, partial [Habropoda laboriosa]